MWSAAVVPGVFEDGGGGGATPGWQLERTTDIRKLAYRRPRARYAPMTLYILDGPDDALTRELHAPAIVRVGPISYRISRGSEDAESVWRVLKLLSVRGIKLRNYFGELRFVSENGAI